MGHLGRRVGLSQREGVEAGCRSAPYDARDGPATENDRPHVPSAKHERPGGPGGWRSSMRSHGHVNRQQATKRHVSRRRALLRVGPPSLSSAAQPGRRPHLSRTGHFSQCITLTRVKLKGWVFGYSKANTNHMKMQTHGSHLVLFLNIFQTTAVATKHRSVWR